MGKIIRRSIAILLCITGLILLIIPSGNVNASYERGDYVLDNGVLVSYKGSDSDITIPLGVSEIGKDAFSGNNTLKSVYIPEKVTKIGYAAFENCKNLEKVIIGSDVKEIGQSAFSGCQSLNYVNIPRYVEKMGSGAFAACPSLSTVNIDPMNRHFLCLDGVIYTSDGRKMVQYLAGRPYSTYEIPVPVEEIGEFGFYGANMLTKVAIIPGVKEIPDYAFLNCNGLNQVFIPDSVEAIRRGAFGGCPSLTSLAIPASVSYIDEKAFTSLTGEQGDMIDSNSGAVLSESSETEPVVTSNMSLSDTDTSNTQPQEEMTDLQKAVQQAMQAAGEEIDNAADTVSDALEQASESIPEEIIESAQNLADKISDKINSGIVNGELGATQIIGGQAVFMMDPKSFTVYGFDINNAQTEDTIADSGNQTPYGETVRNFSGNEFDIIGNNLGHYGGNSPIVNIPDGVTKVGDRLFYKDKDVTEVNLPGSITDIGDFAFARSNISKINIPDGVENIGYAAFYNCSNLNDIYIPSSVKNIELGALDGSGYMNNWKNIEDGNDFLVVGDGILAGYKGFGGSVTVPNGVKTIASGVFEGNTNINSVALPDSLVKIGEDAFNGCTGINSVVLPQNLTVIEDRAFKDTSLSNVSIPASVKEIGLGAFDTSRVNSGLEYVNFEGTNLPDANFKPTASRLSAHNLRTCAFEGTDYAFVNSAADMNSGSIFNAHKYGFRGKVYSVGPQTEDGYQTVELRRVLNHPDKDGVVSVESDFTTGGIPYILSGVRESAFDEYKNSDWCNSPVSQISINGKESSALSDLVSNANNQINNGTNVYNITEDNAININVDPSLGFDHSQVKAKIPSSIERYNLNIAEDMSSQSSFMTAFNNRYGRSDNVIMENLSIDMTDRLSEIPIHKMATGKMEISMPVPQNIQNAPVIRMATLDDNGLLEEVPSEVTELDENGSKSISFVASHLSPYIIYYFTDESPSVYAQDYEEFNLENEIVEDNEALGVPFTETLVVKNLNKKVGIISAKFFVSIILFGIAALLFIYKPKAKE